MCVVNNITSKDLFNIFLKNIFIILLSAIIFAVSAFIYCENFTTKKFKAQCEILVTNGSLITPENGDGTEIENENIDPENPTSTDGDKILNTDVAASINLAPTIIKFLHTDGIYREFAIYLEEEANFNKYSYKQLRNAASIAEGDEKALLLSISFELNSTEDAIFVANRFLDFAPDYIESKIAGCSVLPDPYCDSAVQTAPQTFTTVLVAAVIGALLCYVVVFLVTILNSTITSEEDFSARYNIPVVGNIPDFSLTQSSSSNSKNTSKKSKGGTKNGK